MSIVLKKVEEFDEFEKLFHNVNGFDDCFWEELMIKESFDSKDTIIVVATSDRKPVGLIEIIYNEDEENVEINRLEIQENVRRKGYGREIVNELRKNIDESILIFGYSIAEAVDFWKYVSSYFDEEIYDAIVEEDYDSDFLMHFEI
ncbi:GNAT family N-acetyltransferase (plasmid) [Clostridium perfringens]